jgi:NAD(P)-dependent dehydrogenase (short-subunit alcohol dehydrogenase family)
MRLQDKVAIVTGAGSGIGAATALLFAKHGAKVVASDVNEDSAMKTVEKINETGGTAISVPGDVTDTNQAEAIVRTTVETYGSLHILVNSAGITARNAPPNSSPEEIWDRVIDVNLKGTYLMTWHAVPEMDNADGGSVVNLGSIMSVVGYPASWASGFSPYPVSKGAVLQFTRNLAIEMAGKNIRVNCLGPGFIETPLTQTLRDDPEMKKFLEDRHPIGRLGRPEEIAYAALFLASDESSFMTGSYLPVDGGYTAQ